MLSSLLAFCAARGSVSLKAKAKALGRLKRKTPSRMHFGFAMVDDHFCGAQAWLPAWRKSSQVPAVPAASPPPATNTTETFAAAAGWGAAASGVSIWGHDGGAPTIAPQSSVLSLSAPPFVLSAPAAGSTF